MSASASDQRMKGQGNQSNGPKEHVNEHQDFDSWRSQAHQGYGVPAGDQYISSYYGTTFPYQSFDGGAWSNTGTAAAEGVPFLGNYSGPTHGPNHETYGVDGMFGSGGAGFTSFGQQGFGGTGYGGGEYSTWGRKPTYDEYYQRSGDVDVKGIEHSMQGMTLESQKQGGGNANAESSTSTTSQPKKLTWATIASQPAKPQLTNKKKSMVPPPMIVPRTPSLDIGTWEMRNGSTTSVSVSLQPAAGGSDPSPSPGLVKPPTALPPSVRSFAGPPPRPQVSQRSPLPPMGNLPSTAYPPPPPASTTAAPLLTMPPPTMMPPPPAAPDASPSSPQPSANPVLEELHSKHDYNPKDFDLNAKNARFFVIKSYSEDDIHRSIKYEIWCSTEHGNKRLDSAFRERDGKGPVYLFFSVNGSGHFCGMAEMTSPVDMSATLSVWSQDKWRGQFTVKWIYVKDVPNSALRHIRLENNENKPVTNSRDTQEVLPDKGRQVLRILHNYKHATSIFDDFTHYEKRQAEEDQRKTTIPPPTSPLQNEPPPYDQRRDRERDRDHDRERPEPRDREREREPHRADYREPGRGRGGYDYRDRDIRNHRDGYRSGGGGDYPRDRDSYRGGRGGRPGGGGSRH